MEIKMEMDKRAILVCSTEFIAWIIWGKRFFLYAQFNNRRKSQRLIFVFRRISNEISLFPSKQAHSFVTADGNGNVRNGVIAPEICENLWNKQGLFGGIEMESRSFWNADNAFWCEHVNGKFKIHWHRFD